MNEEKITENTPPIPRKKKVAAKKKSSVKKQAAPKRVAAKKRTVKKAASVQPATAQAATTQPAVKSSTKKRSVKKRGVRSKSVATPPPSHPQITPEQRYRMIAEAAYYLAEKREFAPGYEMEDWITAEKIVQAHIETLSH